MISPKIDSLLHIVQCMRRREWGRNSDVLLCGDGVEMVIKCMGMGWRWKKILLWDGARMGLSFTTV